MKRIVFAATLLALAGCEQTKPPTPQGLKIIAARTALGGVNTKLETKTQPSPPLAGQVSIWDFKVYEIKDKPDGTRTEWWFFNDLPQSSTEKTATGVLMNAWLISKDRSVFLPQKPAYKQYGSFITDWTIPKNGEYTLWVEYQPVLAKRELSLQDARQKAKVLDVEHTHWDLSVGGTATSPPVSPSEMGGNRRVYSLDAANYAAGSGMSVTLNSSPAVVGQKTTLSPTVNGATGSIADESLVALSPDGNTLLHGVGANPRLTFSRKGKWRAWFSFSVDGKFYACPFDIDVS